MTLRRDDFSPTASQAINRVLQAEQEAKQAITAAETEAARLLEAARQRAARILRHADNRITLIHQRCNQGLARAIDARVLAHHRHLADLSQRLELDDERIDAIVTELAASMTGADPQSRHGTE